MTDNQRVRNEHYSGGLYLSRYSDRGSDNSSMRGASESERIRDTRAVHARRNDYPDPRDRRQDFRQYDNGYRNSREYSDSRGARRNQGYDARGPRRDHDPRDKRRSNFQDAGFAKRRQTRNDENRDSFLTQEKMIAKYERRLMEVSRSTTIENFPSSQSLWGMRAKGYEEVTAQRVKLSGLFPLPTAQSSGDSKATSAPANEPEGLLLIGASKIDAIDSLGSRTVIVNSNEEVDFDDVADRIDRFVSLVDMEGLSVTSNIQKKHVVSGSLVIEFKTSQAATIALALGLKASDAFPDHFTLTFSRPGEYVVQCLPPYESTSDVLETVTDSPRKLTLIVKKESSLTPLVDALTKIAPLRALQYLREVGTKEPLGIAYVEFHIDPKQYPRTKSAVMAISELSKKVAALDLVKEVQFSCIKVSENSIETSIQDCPIDIKTLKALVRNEYVPFHPKLKVIQLINVLTVADFSQRDNIKFIKDDILQEARKFGPVVSSHITKPDGPTTLQSGKLKMFIEFETEKNALECLMGMAGRAYNDRTVLCAFFDHRDYKLGLF